MRIIAGRWRGRQIQAPEGLNTRPITDRAKTVLFDVLGARLDRPGSLPPIAILDLFAGTGTLGIESLSRGAAFALFVERHRPTAALIEANLEGLGIAKDEGHVVNGDATAGDFPPPPTPEGRYRLVFVDPPYRLLEGPSPHPTIRTLLQRLGGSTVIAPDALIIVRHAHSPIGGPSLAPLVELERRDVGSMTFRFLTTARAAEAMSDGSCGGNEEPS
jgi:16S rRNA (guanine966-N2)-methyltransferase